MGVSFSQWDVRWGNMEWVKNVHTTWGELFSQWDVGQVGVGYGCVHKVGMADRCQVREV